jgi:hypothetical protein
MAMEAIDITAILAEREAARVVHERPSYQETTLGVWGAALPIGIPVGNPAALEKGFEFAPLNFKREKALDKLRSKKGGSGNHPGKVPAETLAFMLRSWGGDHDFHDKKPKERYRAITNSYMQDVLYAWIYFRVQELGPYLALQAECVQPHCRHEWEWTTDLRGLELTVTREAPQPLPFEFTDEIEFGGRSISGVLLLPPKWRVMSGFTGQTVVGTADIKGRLALDSVHVAVTSSGEHTPAAASMLDEITKADLERLASSVDDLFPKSDPRFEIECPSCGNRQISGLNWTWDFFFGSASLPEALRS